MYKKIGIHIYILFNITWPTMIQAQNNSEIFVVARPLEHKIILRWSPSSTISWYYLNRYGYQLERYTLFRDTQFIDNPESTRLYLGKITPWPMEQFTHAIDTNDRLAIVAQALYGESFVVDAQTLTQYLINRAEELQNRYSFCLLVAAQSLLAAKAAGLYYEDTQVKPNEKYVYRVISLVPDSIDKIDTGYVYVGLSDRKPLPQPLFLSAKADGNQVTLKWDRKHFERIYFYYIIERSTDGVHFQSINDIPYLNLFNSQQDDATYYIRIDTLPEYNVRYYYRIRGVNIFDEIGPPSDTLSVIATQKFNIRPSISKASVLQSSVILIWDFPEEWRNQLKGFEIYRGFSVQQIISPIAVDISPYDSVYRDSSPLASNYYRIRAIDKSGNYTESFPYFVAVEDSIPPVPPTGLKANIDSTGKVTILWDKNLEPDILGYQIYRANYRNEEFFQISTDIVTDTFYFDRVGLYNLSPTVYYCIKALDRHYNPSDFSELIMIRKPDRVAPQPPAITDYRVKDGVVSIHFSPSSSDDVKQYIAYRWSVNDNLWKVCAVIPVNSFGSFTDTCFSAPCNYDYLLIAVDSDGNESIPSFDLKVRILDDFFERIVEKINFYAIKNYELKQIELYWDSLPLSSVKYKIFKSINGGNFQTIFSFNSTNNRYIDRNVELGNLYEYVILHNDIKIKNGNKIKVSF